MTGNAIPPLWAGWKKVVNFWTVWDTEGTRTERLKQTTGKLLTADITFCSRRSPVIKIKSRPLRMDCTSFILSTSFTRPCKNNNIWRKKFQLTHSQIRLRFLHLRVHVMRLTRLKGLLSWTLNSNYLHAYIVHDNRIVFMLNFTLLLSIRIKRIRQHGYNQLFWIIPLNSRRPPLLHLAGVWTFTWLQDDCGTDEY